MHKCNKCGYEILVYGQGFHCECEDGDEWVLVRKVH